VYNAQKTVLRALHSVINQTIKPFEIILINDGSKDESLSIIQNFIKGHNEFNFKVIDKTNGGVSSARNAGLKIAKGDFIAFLDSDDEWFLNKSQKQIDIFKSRPDVDFIGGLIYKPKSSIKGNLKEIKLSMLILKNYFQPSTVMIRRVIIDSVGLFDESQKYAEEGNYFMRIANLHKCTLLNEQVVLYDQGISGFGHSGLSANLLEMEKGELRNLKFAYDQRYISLPKYLIVLPFSILKYFRRILIVKLKK
jgi:glycosyltransferase involved in cell wall biosynthesis